jgi:predicted nucleic acid-binding protein
MTTGSDTNILLDILFDSAEYADGATRALHDALSLGPVVICPIVYAELAAQFPSHEELTAFLQDLTIRLVGFEADALFAAARAWRRYTARRGTSAQCPDCGRSFAVQCPACGRPISWRQHVIPDFLIGAHALVQTEALLSRDRGYYRTYFPDLRLIVPTKA